MIIPYKTEVLIRRWPISNFAVITTCFLVFYLQATDILPESVIDILRLNGWQPVGLITHQFLHAGLFHILANMFFLWLFGNVVCSKLGNLKFLLSFLFCGVFAAVLHNFIDGAPAVGASGAVNGIVGMYLVICPFNKFRCVYWIFHYIGRLSVRGGWIILMWFLTDLCGAIFIGQSSNVAYWAHLEGFLSGFVLGILFLKIDWILLDEFDHQTLLDYLNNKKPFKRKSDSGTAADGVAKSFD